MRGVAQGSLARRLAVLPVLLLAGVLLGGCPSNEVASPGSLPTVPADIQACFRDAAGTAIPNRALTVAEIESLWKTDRVQVVVLKKCGTRFINWYNNIQKRWR